jgi:hypothetical protein
VLAAGALYNVGNALGEAGRPVEQVEDAYRQAASAGREADRRVFTWHTWVATFCYHAATTPSRTTPIQAKMRSVLILGFPLG